MLQVLLEDAFLHLCFGVAQGVQTLDPSAENAEQADTVLLVLTVFAGLQSQHDATQDLEALEAMQVGINLADDAGKGSLPVALGTAADAAAHKAPVPWSL